MRMNYMGRLRDSTMNLLVELLWWVEHDQCWVVPYREYRVQLQPSEEKIAEVEAEADYCMENSKTLFVTKMKIEKSLAIPIPNVEKRVTA